MISDPSDYKKFRVTDCLWEGNMHEFFSWVRFVEFDENYVTLIDFEAREANRKGWNDDSDDERMDMNRGFKAKKLPPLSMWNE